MNSRVIIIGLLSVTLVSAYYLQKNDSPLLVKSHTVALGKVKSSISNTRVGTVKACRRAYLAPSTGGNVARLFIQEGEQVKKNQLLLKVWNEDLKAQKKLYKAQLNVAKANQQQICELAAGAARESERLRPLTHIAQVISVDQLDKAETTEKATHAQCHSANAAVQVARANIEYNLAMIERTLIRAPFDGTIAEINAELGEYITPSPPGIPTLPPIDLLDLSCLYISAPIDEVDAAPIEIGMPVCVSLDAFTEKRCSGKVTRIAPYVLEKAKQARTVDVEVTLSDPEELKGLLTGYSADIEILIAEKEHTLRLPTEAIIDNDHVLLINSQQQLETRYFQAGLSNWHFVEVLSGLKTGDKVVLSVNQEGLTEGRSIRSTP